MQSSSDNIIILLLLFLSNKLKSKTLSKLSSIKNPPNGIPSCAALNFFLFNIPPQISIISLSVAFSGTSIIPGLFILPDTATFLLPYSVICFNSSSPKNENTDPRELWISVVFLCDIFLTPYL